MAGGGVDTSAGAPPFGLLGDFLVLARAAGRDGVGRLSGIALAGGGTSTVAPTGVSHLSAGRNGMRRNGVWRNDVGGVDEDQRGDPFQFALELESGHAPGQVWLAARRVRCGWVPRDGGPKQQMILF